MRQERFAQIVLLLTGIVFLLVGGTGLRTPEKIMGPLGVTLDGRPALNEVRANYGAAHLGLGIWFICGGLIPRYRLGAIATVTAFVGGLVLGRLISLAVDGPPGPFVAMLFAVEFVGALAGLAAFLGLRRLRKGYEEAAETPLP